MNITVSATHWFDFVLQVKRLMEHTVSKHRKIDFLVNNGGGQFRAAVSEYSTKGWHAVMDTNLNGTYYCLKHGKQQVFLLVAS